MYNYIYNIYTKNTFAIILIVYIFKEYIIELIHSHQKLFHDGFIIVQDFFHQENIKRILFFIKMNTIII